MLPGANAPFIREYDIATSTAIKDGEAVGIADNKVVAAESGDHVLGVAAEEHTGKHDELNARADGGKIRVNIAPQAIYEASLPCFTATGGSATTLVIPSSGRFRRRLRRTRGACFQSGFFGQHR